MSQAALFEPDGSTMTIEEYMASRGMEPPSEDELSEARRELSTPG